MSEVDELRARVAAQHEQIEQLRAALREACDALEEIAEGQLGIGALLQQREKIAALRKLTGDS